MNTAPDLTIPTPIAETNRTKAAETPGIKLQSHGFAIDHADQNLGERLMVDALGVADREAMHGIVRQLVKASVSGESPGHHRLHAFDGEEHSPAGLRRGHAGDADGFGSRDG